MGRLAAQPAKRLIVSQFQFATVRWDRFLPRDRFFLIRTLSCARGRGRCSLGNSNASRLGRNFCLLSRSGQAFCNAPLVTDSFFASKDFSFMAIGILSTGFASSIKKPKPAAVPNALAASTSKETFWLANASTSFSKRSFVEARSLAHAPLHRFRAGQTKILGDAVVTGYGAVYGRLVTLLTIHCFCGSLSACRGQNLQSDGHAVRTARRSSASRFRGRAYRRRRQPRGR